MRPVVGPRRRPPPRSPKITSSNGPGLPGPALRCSSGAQDPDREGMRPARSTTLPQRGRRHDWARGFRAPRPVRRRHRCTATAAHLGTDACVQGIGCMGVWCSQQPLTYSAHAWLPVSPRRARAMKIRTNRSCGWARPFELTPAFGAGQMRSLARSLEQTASRRRWAAAARGLLPRGAWARGYRARADDRGHARKALWQGTLARHSGKALWRTNWRIPWRTSRQPRRQPL